MHSPAILRPEDRTIHRGIPCTTVARTVLDLAEVVDGQQVERALDRAEVLRLLDMRALDDVLDRAAGRRAAGVVRAVLGSQQPLGETVTRSELEERFLRLCTTAGLELPHVNTPVETSGGGIEVDFLWPEHRLAVETDGHATHSTRQAFERDRERDRLLLLAGWRTVRFTWRHVNAKPADVASTLQALLGPG